MQGLFEADLPSGVLVRLLCPPCQRVQGKWRHPCRLRARGGCARHACLHGVYIHVGYVLYRHRVVIKRSDMYLFGTRTRNRITGMLAV